MHQNEIQIIESELPVIESELPDTVGSALVPLMRSSEAPLRQRKKEIFRVLDRKATKADFRHAARLLREAPEAIDSQDNLGFHGVRRIMQGASHSLAGRAAGSHTDQRYDRDLVIADMENQAEDMAGASPSPAVLLLAERVVQTRLILQLTEKRYAEDLAEFDKKRKLLASGNVMADDDFDFVSHFGKGPTANLLREKMLIPDHEAHLKRIERAQRMYLAALCALAEVQKIALPPMSIAMPGSLQVNMMSNKKDTTP